MVSYFSRASSPLISPAATFSRSSRPMAWSRFWMSDSIRSSSASSAGRSRRPFIRWSPSLRLRDRIRSSIASYFRLASSSVISPAATCSRSSRPMAWSRFCMPAFDPRRSFLAPLSSSTTFFAVFASVPRSWARAGASRATAAKESPAIVRSEQADRARHPTLRGCRLQTKRRETRCMSEPPVAARIDSWLLFRVRSVSRVSRASASDRGDPAMVKASSSQQFSRSTRICRDSHQVTGWKKRAISMMPCNRLRTWSRRLMCRSSCARIVSS